MGGGGSLLLVCLVACLLACLLACLPVRSLAYCSLHIFFVYSFVLGLFVNWLLVESPSQSVD